MGRLYQPQDPTIVSTLEVLLIAALVLVTPPIDPDDVFFLVIGLTTLLAILWFGWTTFAAAGQPVRHPALDHS